MRKRNLNINQLSIRKAVSEKSAFYKMSLLGHDNVLEISYNNNEPVAAP